MAPNSLPFLPLRGEVSVLSALSFGRIEHSRSNAAPVSRTRPQEIGTFYFLSLSPAFGNQLPCLEEAQEALWRGPHGEELGCGSQPSYKGAFQVH